MLTDLRRALRTLRTSPGLVAVSTLSLGLGLGVNLALFGAVRSIFLHTPTATAPHQLVGVEPGNGNQLSFANLRDLADTRIFSAVTGFRPVPLNLRSNDTVTRVRALAVTPNFFDVLGVRAAEGRTFSASETIPSREPRLAVVSDAFRRRHFGAGPLANGRPLVLNGEAFDVVGVLPADYRSVSAIERFDVYVPLSRLVFPTLDDRINGNALAVIARLTTDMTPAQAQSAVTLFGQRLEARYPNENAGMGQPARILPLAVREFGGWQEPAFIGGALLVLVGLVLLSACANVAGLLLARAARQQRELAVRAALGAERHRLVRMLLIESLSLACLGGLAGGALFLWLRRLLTALTLPFGEATLVLDLDAIVAIYAGALVIGTGILCGLVPALRATRADVGTELKNGDARGTTGRLRLRHGFVVAQVAVSLVLLTLSSLLLRSLVRITSLDPGFDVERVAVALLHVPADRYLADGGLPLGERLVARLSSHPDVTGVGFANIIALGNDQSATRPQVDGASAGVPGARTFLNSVSQGYFAALGIPVLRGRDFTVRDRAGSPAVAIVSEAFERANFPAGSALGQRVRRQPDEPWAEIVGVVRDSKYGSVAEVPAPILYMPYAQQPRVSSQVRPLILHVRTNGDLAPLVSELRRLVAEEAPDEAAEVHPLSAMTGTEASLRRLGTRLLGTTGAVALLLSMMGLYGMMAFIVSSRAAEIGTRMALGATAGRVQRQILGQAARLVTSGVLVGWMCAWLAARTMVGSLAGVSPADPAAFLSAAAVLLVVGIGASYTPARRASRLDATIALRVD